MQITIMIEVLYLTITMIVDRQASLVTIDENDGQAAIKMFLCVCPWKISCGNSIICHDGLTPTPRTSEGQYCLTGQDCTQACANRIEEGIRLTI